MRSRAEGSGCRATRVVHENRHTSGDHVVRVQFLDREVPAVRRTGCDPGPDDGGVSVVGRVEGVFGAEFTGWLPGVGGVVPEGVVGGGVEGCGVAVPVADGDVEEVRVVVDPDVLNGATALVLARSGSADSTLSPVLILPMALVLPPAMRTGVSGEKLHCERAVVPELPVPGLSGVAADLLDAAASLWESDFLGAAALVPAESLVDSLPAPEAAAASPEPLPASCGAASAEAFGALPAPPAPAAAGGESASSPPMGSPPPQPMAMQSAPPARPPTAPIASPAAMRHAGAATTVSAQAATATTTTTTTATTTTTVAIFSATGSAFLK